MSIQKTHRFFFNIHPYLNSYLFFLEFLNIIHNVGKTIKLHSSYIDFITLKYFSNATLTGLNHLKVNPHMADALRYLFMYEHINMSFKVKSFNQTINYK